MSKVKISTLFSTFNRCTLLCKALDYLVMQTLPRDQFEVIVIDDGSTDNTKKVVESFNNKLFIRYVYQRNQGIAVAKNHAIQMASAPLVLFMDDDDLADSNLLAEHIGTHEKYKEENIAVLGYTGLSDEVSLSPLMHFVTQVGYYLFCYPKLNNGDVLDYTYFWGGRSSCKKDLIQKIGGFDPIFKFGCEDIELGYRLHANGFKVIYNENARSTMIRTISLNDFCHRVEKQGYSNWIFSKKHPKPEVELWTEVIGLDTHWAYVKPYYKTCAQRLERIIYARKKYDLEIDDLLLSLLHNMYWKVLDGFRVKGSYQACQDYKQDKKVKGFKK